ncbi:MAG: 2'-5' RNA ligase family protein [Leeuwenhoekiella sp.]
MIDLKIYSLRIVPPLSISEEINNYKHLHISNFGKQPLAQSKPHITLAEFLMDTQYEDKLIRTFNELSSIEKFPIGITGFEMFEKSSVLFLNVSEPVGLKDIHLKTKQLWQYKIRRKMKSITIPRKPHITISKMEDKNILRTSFDFFRTMEFNEKDFQVDNLILTSRYTYTTWNWEHKILLS